LNIVNSDIKKNHSVYNNIDDDLSKEEELIFDFKKNEKTLSKNQKKNKNLFENKFKR